MKSMQDEPKVARQTARVTDLLNFFDFSLKLLILCLIFHILSTGGYTHRDVFGLLSSRRGSRGRRDGMGQWARRRITGHDGGLKETSASDGQLSVGLASSQNCWYNIPNQLWAKG